jgi:hypothetical protein
MHEEARPEFACPYCYDDHDVASLCVHLEEEHPFEPHAANRRRLRRFVIPGSQGLSLLSRDLCEAHLQVLLGGGQRSSNDNTMTNISADPLLSSFGLGFPTSDAEETSTSTISIPEETTMVKETPAGVQKKLSTDSSLATEEREQKRKQASVRATFVQDLLLSTLFGDWN